MDSLDPIRDIVARRDTTIYTVELAKAVLELAEKNDDLRRRVCSLELDRDMHGRRLDIQLRGIDHLEIDRTEAARISAANSQHIHDIAEILRETIGTVERVDLRAKTLSDAFRTLQAIIRTLRTDIDDTKDVLDRHLA